MTFLYYVLFVAAAAAADQIVKFLVVANIPLNGTVPVIPGVVSLTYVQNFGAAFSSFQGQLGLFFLLFLVFTVAIFIEYFKKPMSFSRFERWCIAAVYAGGLGNIIDRAAHGYVVDMIQTEFMEFAVFNVADCFITCGCIAMIVSLVFFNRNFWKESGGK